MEIKEVIRLAPLKAKTTEPYMSITPESLLNNNLELVSLPDIVFQINDMLSDPACTAVDIGNIISQDTGLTMRLLKIVNSPFYGFPSAIETIPMAITVLGVRQLRDLVFMTSVINKYSHIPTDILSPETFWSHSIATAIAAQLLAKEVKLSNNERLFTCGMLHDLGQLIMAIVVPEETRQILELAHNSNKPSHELQMNVFGFSQGDLGVALIRKWNLPESFIEPIQLQQLNKPALRYPMETAIIKIASVMANNNEATALTGDNQIIHPGTLEILGIDNNIISDIQEITMDKVQAVSSVLYTKQAA